MSFSKESTIQALIFDLGGVFINIDYQLTSRAFRELGAKNFDAVYSQREQTTLFSDYETGKIDDNTFRSRLRDLLSLSTNVTDQQIDDAWNAMLLDAIPENITYVSRLRALGYRVVLFSNTNNIHMRVVRERFRKAGLSDLVLESTFNIVYYSHIFGHRKPNTDTFLEILRLNHFSAKSTVFIDDSSQHIEGAKTAGLFGLHLTNPLHLADTVNHFLAIKKSPTVEQETSHRVFSFSKL